MFRNKRKAAVISGCFTLAVMCMIFYFSSQEADLSREMSGTLYKLLCEIAHWFLPSQEKQATFDKMLSLYIRKYAHFTEFTLLGLCLTLFFAVWLPRLRLLPLPTLTAGVLYACSDEWHQTFVAGRSGEIRDVLIDSGGLILGLLLALLFLRLFEYFRQKSQKRKNAHSSSNAPV